VLNYSCHRHVVIFLRDGLPHLSRTEPVKRGAAGEVRGAGGEVPALSIQARTSVSGPRSLGALGHMPKAYPPELAWRVVWRVWNAGWWAPQLPGERESSLVRDIASNDWGLAVSTGYVRNVWHRY
jgi:hypothetical protein